MTISRSVRNTIRYFHYFYYPPSPQEVHRFLITPTKIPYSKVKKYTPPLTPKELLIRSIRQKNSLLKTQLAKALTPLFLSIPTIFMVALTGSVSVNNAKKKDDIDLLIVCAPHSLWLTRVFLKLVFILFFPVRRPGRPHETKNRLCPNLFLDYSHLSVPHSKRNLYIAHEVLQIKPIFVRHNTDQLFFQANAWTGKYLANATPSKQTTKAPFLALYYLLLPFNLLFYVVQYLYMYPKITTEYVTLTQAFFHKKNPARKLTKFLSASYNK